jgi:hypothetical protein
VPNQDIPVQSGGKTSTQAADTLRVLAEVESQQDPTFQSSLAYTRLTTKSALKALQQAGVEESILPSENGMGLILNRLGYRLRKVVKAKPKVPETDAIFENIKAKDQLNQNTGIKRLSMDCKATVNLGEYSRGVKHAVRIRH